MVEDEDERWKLFLASQADSSREELKKYVAKMLICILLDIPLCKLGVLIIINDPFNEWIEYCRLTKQPLQEKDSTQNDIKNSLLDGFVKGVIARKHDEAKIQQKAKSALDAFAKQLSKPTQREYYKSEDIQCGRVATSEYLRVVQPLFVGRKKSINNIAILQHT